VNWSQRCPPFAWLLTPGHTALVIATADFPESSPAEPPAQPLKNNPCPFAGFERFFLKYRNLSQRMLF
jgi:hypothetical protein